MALPTILIDSGSGSDTAASGAGPATALFGTGASLNSTTAVDLSADAPDLSGVATDGSAALWVDTTSGRQFGRITAVNNGTKVVTVATAYGVTEATRNWGIGGKRATLNHADTRTLGADAEEGWVIEIAAGDTQTLTSTFTITADGGVTSGRLTVRGASGTRAIVTSSTNSVALFTLNGAQFLTFSHLNLTHTAATRGIGILCSTANSNNLIVKDCVIDGCLNGVDDSALSSSPVQISSCEIKNCTNVGIRAGAGRYLVNACYIHDNTVDGISYPNASNGEVWLSRTAIVKNAGRGINLTTSSRTYILSVINCTIADNTSSGIDDQTTTGSMRLLNFYNNIIYGNGAWGIVSANAQVETDAYNLFDSNNAFGSNSSGARSNIATGENEVTLTANPFTNDSGANRDFSLNNTAGGGAACRAAGYPGAFVGGTFTGYPDIGAVQHQDSGSGSTVGWW